MCAQLFSAAIAARQHPLRPDPAKEGRGTTFIVTLMAWRCQNNFSRYKFNVFLSPLETATGLIVIGEMQFLYGLMPRALRSIPSRTCTKSFILTTVQFL